MLRSKGYYHIDDKILWVNHNPEPPKMHFLTFCNTGYFGHPTLGRIQQEAIHMNIFDSISCMTENSLDQAFMDRHKDFINSSSRGYGYWIWKSHLIQRKLASMNDDDILIYCDAGNTLNKKGIVRLFEYFKILNQSPTGIVVFQMADSLTEERFTKMQVFQHLDCMEKKYLESPQITGSTILIRKCKHSVDLFSKISKMIDDQLYYLFDDSPSSIPNSINFVDHRHDQSVMSLMYKYYGAHIIPDDETYKYPFEQYGTDYPIWTSRIKFY
jgi:hypothetical protein